MNKLSPLTIIDDKNRRGVIAPAKAISRKLLEDIIDLIELSSPEVIKETARRIGEANRGKSWVPLEKARVLVNLLPANFLF